MGAGDLAFNYRVGQIGTVSPTARHRRYDIFSEHFFRHALSRGDDPRQPPLVTSFGVIARVNDDLICNISNLDYLVSV